MTPPAGELELTGRITTASNATFVGTLGATEVVYKPIEGERPLWDFPDAVLAHREVAAYLVSEALGWSVVPLTWLGEGPFGEGMLQLWQDVDPDQDAVDLVPSESRPAGWRRVFEGRDDDDRRVSLIHEDSTALRRMAVFDVLVNNADRKGGHVLAMPGGHRYGVDHGITFHVEPKLRTVLWGWIGEPLHDDELAAVSRLRAELDGGALAASLEPLLPEPERLALDGRCARLLAEGVFPSPEGDMPPIPYPLF